jgi:tetratricopeptide (TPR) repeat protein
MKNIILKFFLLTITLILLPALTLLIPLNNYFELCAQTEEQCEEQLSKAEEEYQLGKWTEAIELIEQCLKKPNVAESEKGKAYRLLGLVYIAIQLEKEANEAVKNLLMMVPNYKIDPDRDPPSLKKIIDNTAQTLNPIVTSINPNKIEAGKKGFTITVNGKNFVYGSVVKFNGLNKSTSYISSIELKADIPPGDILDEGEININVYSPILGGKTSNSETLIVEKSSSFPWTWIAVGGGAIVAAVVAVLTLGGDDNGPEPSTTIADPPGRP